MTADDALANARAFLATARNPDDGWGFVAGAPSEPEPTVLCAGAGAGASGAWLRSTDLTYAHLLAPAALAGIAEADAVRDASIAQILTVRGATFPRVADAEVPLDSETPGWPWFGDSFSWVEPTAYAVLSLRKAGRREGRAQRASRRSRDRGEAEPARRRRRREAPAPPGRETLALPSARSTSPHGSRPPRTAYSPPTTSGRPSSAYRGGSPRALARSLMAPSRTVWMPKIAQAVPREG